MKHKSKFYEKYLKRLMDILLSAAGLILLSPVFLVTAVLVRLKLGSPVIFRQARPGRNGEIFHLYKFRSMTDARDVDGNLLPDEVRLTSFGKKLRASSLDELPELLNILRGDMSIVGPRPLLVKYLPLYNEEQRHRHDVRPGLTGWAQVNGRNSVTWEDKFRLDLWYVQNMSFLVDMKIILLTVRSVLRRDGISSDTAVTMEEFTGTKENAS